MVSCVVPGCTNTNIRWVARVPENVQLRDFWREAIRGGTGVWLPRAISCGYVCQVHFVPAQQPECGEMYREPTLFLINNSWRRVSCCQLCLRYYPVESMFNRKGHLGGYLTLQSLAFKYFRVRQFTHINNGRTGEKETDSYFCANCVVRIEITHRFAESVVEKGRAFERMLRNVTKTTVGFVRVGGDSDEQEVHEEDQGDGGSEEFVGEIQENEFETIALDDDDEEPAVEIKKEPDLEEAPVRIKAEPGLEETAVQVKMEVPDEDLPPFQVKVKEEVSEEPPDKKPRIQYKFGCLICKEFFKYEIALTTHLKKVHKEFPEDRCIQCWKTILPRGDLSRCGTCEASDRGGGETGNPSKIHERCEGSMPKEIPNQKILNKNIKPSESDHYCALCHKSFLTKMLLITHQRKLSCKQPKSVCTQCNGNFLSEENLAAHLELDHVPPVLLQNCKFCGQIFSPNMFKLHRTLLCGDDLPEPDETHLKRCVLFFYRQKLQATETHFLLQSRFSEKEGITLDMVNTLYSQFEQDDFTIGDPVQTSINQLIDENPTINPEELSEQVDADLNSVQLQVNLLGLMQKYGRWVPQNLHPSLKKNRFNFCRALLARFKNNANLNNIILCSERWVYYGTPPTAQTNTKEPHKKALLCIWWDQRGLIFHELLTPEQAANKERYHSQFSRFTKTMTQLRPGATRIQMIFQYGIPDLVARQELKAILNAIGWEMLRHPAHSPDIDPTDYHLFQTMQRGFRELYFANPGQVYEWVAQECSKKPPAFFLQGIRMLVRRWEKVVENKGDYCGQ